MNDKSKIITTIEEMINMLMNLQGIVLTPTQKGVITKQSKQIQNLFVSGAPESLEYIANYYSLLINVLSSSIEMEIRNNSRKYIGYYLPKKIKEEKNKIINKHTKEKRDILIACGQYFLNDYQKSIIKVHEKYNLTSRDVTEVINKYLMQSQGVTAKEQIDFSSLKQAKINLLKDYFASTAGAKKYSDDKPISEGFLRKIIDEFKNEDPILFEEMKQERDNKISSKKIEEVELADKIREYINNGIDYGNHHILFTVIDYYCLTDIDPLYLFKMNNTQSVDEQTLFNIRNANLLLEINASSFFKTNITLNEKGVTLEELENIENILKNNNIKVTKVSMGIALERYFEGIPILPLLPKEPKRNLSC